MDLNAVAWSECLQHALLVTMETNVELLLVSCHAPHDNRFLHALFSHGKQGLLLNAMQIYHHSDRRRMRKSCSMYNSR